jgi:hypothetical protein
MLTCIVAAKASATAAVLIIFVSPGFDVCYNKHQLRVKANGVRWNSEIE